MKIRINAYLVLKENYEQTDHQETFREWVETTASNDPNFFRWLFDEVGNENLQDFECPDENMYRIFLDEFCSEDFNCGDCASEPICPKSPEACK